MAYKAPAASTTVTGCAKFDAKDVLVTAGLVQHKCGLQPGNHNLGVTYAGGTFTVCSASQAALSATNPGYVTLQSKTPGKLVTVAVTANQDFIDDAGASQIIGNLFGLPTGVAYVLDIPFYLYAILKEDESAVAFACARVPNITASPAVAKLGRPSDATADTQGSMFVFEDVTLADYDLNPVLLIGSFRMQMSAADDWTISALDFSFDGIGKYQESNTFRVPAATFGAAAGTNFKDNAGTAPVFTDNLHYYYIYPDGNVWHEYYFNGDGGTDGAGAVTTYMCAPIIPAQISALTPSGSAYIYNTNTVTSTVGNIMYDSAAPTGWFFQGATGGAVKNSHFGNGARIMGGHIVYRCSTA